MIPSMAPLALAIIYSAVVNIEGGVPVNSAISQPKIVHSHIQSIPLAHNASMDHRQIGGKKHLSFQRKEKFPSMAINEGDKRGAKMHTMRRGYSANFVDNADAKINSSGYDGKIFGGQKHPPMEMERPLLVIGGSTGTGKSDLAVEIAKALGNGEVISADSMQIYKGLDIASNKVTEEEMGGIPHHLMSFLQPNDSHYDRWNFRDDALREMERIWRRGGVPILAGGSVPYIESILYAGERPKRPVGIGIHDLLEMFPTREALYQKLRELDPETAKDIVPENTAKVVEELQSWYFSGEWVSRRQKMIIDMANKGIGEAEKDAAENSGQLRFKNTFIIYLDTDDKKAHERSLFGRIDKMLKRGLLTELEEFYAKYEKHVGWPFGAMQTIGLIAFLPYLRLSKADKLTDNGKRVFEECKKAFQIGDTKYARNQRGNFYKRILKPGANKETPNAVALNKSRNFEDEVIPLAKDLVKDFLSGGKKMDEIKKRHTGVQMEIGSWEEETTENNTY